MQINVNIPNLLPERLSKQFEEEIANYLKLYLESVAATMMLALIPKDAYAMVDINVLEGLVSVNKAKINVNEMFDNAIDKLTFAANQQEDRKC